MTVKIISAQRLRELLNYDPITGIFTRLVATSNRIKIGDITGCIATIGYKYISLENKLYLAHRLVWLYIHGVWPTKTIDHINGDRADNRLCNLRDVSQQENNHNLHGLCVKNTSGFTGITQHKQTKRWRAVIVVNNKTKHIGYFATIDDAVVARNAAKLQFHPSCPSIHITRS